MTTYSTSLRLTKQATGANSNTWGEVLNAGVFDMVDAAIAGFASVVVSASDITLTVDDGASDQARNAILKCTGTLTNNRAIIVPAVSKVYIVWNATSGAFNLTVKTSAGTGIVVPQGYAMLLFCDGTNVESRMFVSADAAARPWIEKSSAYTAQSGERILATGTAFTITLPSSPSIGDTVTVCDAAGNSTTENKTIARNGANIMGLAENMVLDLNGATAELVYAGASRGWVLVQR